LAQGIIVSGNTSNEVRVPFNSDQTLALAGPVTFILPWNNLGKLLVSFKMISSSYIKTVVVPNPALFSQTNQVDIFVPDGKTIHCFQPFDRSSDTGISDLPGGMVIISKGSSLISVPLFGGEEFSGPLTVTIQSVGPQAAVKAYSYYLLEDFFVVPQSGLLQGPTGSFEITIEKSADLGNWFPTVIHPTSDDQKAFYRLKLSR